MKLIFGYMIKDNVNLSSGILIKYSRELEKYLNNIQSHQAEQQQ